MAEVSKTLAQQKEDRGFVSFRWTRGTQKTEGKLTSCCDEENERTELFCKAYQHLRLQRLQLLYRRQQRVAPTGTSLRQRKVKGGEVYLEVHRCEPRERHKGRRLLQFVESLMVTT